jgi:hypothetical protein
MRKYDYRRAIIKVWFDPPSLPSSPERMWASKTPRNIKELELHTMLVKEKIRFHKIAR